MLCHNHLSVSARCYSKGSSYSLRSCDFSSSSPTTWHTMQNGQVQQEKTRRPGQGAGATSHPKQSLLWSCLSPCFTPVSLFPSQGAGRCSLGPQRAAVSMRWTWEEAPGRDCKLITRLVHWAALHSKDPLQLTLESLTS